MIFKGEKFFIFIILTGLTFDFNICCGLKSFKDIRLPSYTNFYILVDYNLETTFPLHIKGILTFQKPLFHELFKFRSFLYGSSTFQITRTLAQPSISPNIPSERESRIQKLHEIKQHFNISSSNEGLSNITSISHILSSFSSLSQQEASSESLQICGRIINFRNNMNFIDIQDNTGSIQLYLPTQFKNDNSTLSKIRKYLDRGDIISVTGYPMKTLKNQLSIKCKSVTLLTKCLNPLPDKFRGLKNIDVRYKNREIDLISNASSLRTIRDRFKILSIIRNQMTKNGFLEVETPIIQNIVGGASATPFTISDYNVGHDRYLRISPELFLKRLIVGGLSEKIFELSKSFRNEGTSTWHHPEFTTLEAYQTYSNYTDAMRLTEHIIRNTAIELEGSPYVSFQGQNISLVGPWATCSMLSIIQNYTAINFSTLNYSQARSKLQDLFPTHDFKLEKTWGHLVQFAFDNLVQPHLIQPIHILHHPTELSPLAKKMAQNSSFTERFESFIYGKEIANGYSELTDPFDQKLRFLAQLDNTKKHKLLNPEIDQDFIDSLEIGMPPTSGIGIGIDRLAMILTDSPSIRDVIAFPLMKKH